MFGAGLPPAGKIEAIYKMAKILRKNWRWINSCFSDFFLYLSFNHATLQLPLGRCYFFCLSNEALAKLDCRPVSGGA
jgi:hypothetical protein